MNEKAQMKHKILSNLSWKFLERGLVQGVQFIISLFLARLLLPADYGVLALVLIFISIANVFIQSGLNSSLIQKKSVESIDLSSVFYVSLALATVLYGFLFVVAPVVARFYGNEDLTLVLRILALTLFPGVFNSLQNAVVSRTMRFKKLFFSSIGAGVLSGIVGIILAYLGYGVWALVFQHLVSQVSITIILWITVRWRPTLEFSFDRVKTLFSYGWKLLVSSLLDTIYRELRSLIIGKVYSASVLGFYNRGQHFPQLIAKNINGPIQSVLFPALASQQDYSERVKSMMRRSIVTSSFIVFPMMIGLAVVAKPLITLLLTERWLPAVPFMQMFCISYALWPIQTANLQAINAMGRSDIFLRLVIIEKAFGVVLLMISLPFGVYYLAMSEIFTGMIATFIYAKPNKKLLGYGYKEQAKDLLPPLCLSLIMGFAVFTIQYLHFSPIITMSMQIMAGIVLYFGLAYLCKLESFDYLLKTVRTYIKKRKKKRA
ncbi:MAG: lipopolysaccharide biosynthesis protein [Spirochaetia bacterium]|nr:lipopolysaccharide biosynthesis protein [Spirochaetia bacterium]